MSHQVELNPHQVKPSLVHLISS